MRDSLLGKAQDRGTAEAEGGRRGRERLLVVQKGFLLGVVTCAKTHCADACETLNTLKTHRVVHGKWVDHLVHESHLNEAVKFFLKCIII